MMVVGLQVALAVVRIGDGPPEDGVMVQGESYGCLLEMGVE